MILLTVKPGEEVIESLSRRAAEEGITDGAIVSLIGAIDACTISNMPTNDSRSDIVTEYAQPCELSGAGEIIDGNVHIHATLGREGDIALAGHLHRARVDTHFVHAYVQPMTNRG
jgi:uncharacterized protein